MHKNFRKKETFMKGRKLLSAIIAGAMVLGTMSFPVFAESGTVNGEADFATAVQNATVVDGVVTYTINGEVKYDAARDDSTRQVNLAKNGADTVVITSESGAKLTMIGDEYYGILASGADLTISNVTLADNRTNNGWEQTYIWAISKSVKYTGCTFEEGVITEGDSPLIVENCIFNTASGKYAAWAKQNGNLTVTGCTFNGPRAVKLGNDLSDKTAVANITNNEFTALSEKPAIAISNAATVTASGNEVTESSTVRAMYLVENNTTELIADDAVAYVINGEGCKEFYTTVEAAEAAAKTAGITAYTVVAKVNGQFYSTLADALAAAQDGDTIDLLDNTIELDGQTTIDKDITITNGTFDITDAFCTTEGIIYIYDSSVAFNNVYLTGSNFTSAFGVIFANHNANVILDNCDFRLKNDLAPLGGTLKGNDSASFTVKNCTFDLENPSRVLTDIKLDMSGTTIKAYVTDTTRTADDLNNHAFRNVYGVIKDSTIDVTGTETGLKNTDSGSLLITGTSNVSFTNTVDANIYLNDENEILTVEPPANVIGDIVYKTVSESVLTDKITVNFVPTADENVYDIVLDGNYKEIYEFVSAEIQFVNAGNGYEIDGTDDINVIANTKNSDRYGFYLKDGTLSNRITATKIKIGTVTFPAQGKIDFKVDANNSKVVATEYNTHLEKYYTAADANAKLTADENGITGTIEAATRNVVVNVDFAHTLDNTGWNGDHQITVTLKNAFGETSDAMNISDGEEPFANVPLGRITVTLKAPGFRTYTYTTTVEEGTDPLVLSFWNDTKRDTTAEVEPGKAMANNFVVGDIAMDYIVDKYDLAAVTSYYGTYNLTDENKIRYDLNRDGNIDITDVAYVLHNFGF